MPDYELLVLLLFSIRYIDVTLQDHLIIGQTKHSSYKSEGLI